jgi:hypothetical protein
MPLSEGAQAVLPATARDLPADAALDADARRAPAPSAALHYDALVVS